MKWKIVLAMTICLAFGVATAFATLTTTVIGGTPYTLSAGGNATGLSINPSTKVVLILNSAGTGNTYALGACHSAGDKAFGTASNSTAFYFKAIGVNNCNAATGYAISGTDSGAFSTYTII